MANLQFALLDTGPEGVCRVPDSEAGDRGQAAPGGGRGVQGSGLKAYWFGSGDNFPLCTVFRPPYGLPLGPRSRPPLLAPSLHLPAPDRGVGGRAGCPQEVWRGQDRPQRQPAGQGVAHGGGPACWLLSRRFVSLFVVCAAWLQCALLQAHSASRPAAQASLQGSQPDGHAADPLRARLSLSHSQLAYYINSTRKPVEMDENEQRVRRWLQGRAEGLGWYWAEQQPACSLCPHPHATCSLAPRLLHTPNPLAPSNFALT